MENESTSSYFSLGETQHQMQGYKAALQSHQRALAIRIKLFGKEHESTADSYFSLGVTQHQMHDYNAAQQSKQRALNCLEKNMKALLRIKLFGEATSALV